MVISSNGRAEIEYGISDIIDRNFDLWHTGISIITSDEPVERVWHLDMRHVVLPKKAHLTRRKRPPDAKDH